MRLLLIFFLGITLFQVNVFADLSTSSCAILRTANSLTIIIPECFQVALRYYRASTFPAEHHRQKRFLFGDKTGKEGSSASLQGSVAEQVMANAIRDVNLTNVALLILNNNETMNKIRQYVDSDAIIRIIMREVDYEKLGMGLWSTAENRFDLEHFISSILNLTNIDKLHKDFLANGTIPERFLKMIYPDLNPQTVKRMLSTLKNVTNKFVEILSKSERFDNYLFNMITYQALAPLNNIIQGVKEDKPKTLYDLVEIIVQNVNKVAVNQFAATTKDKSAKKSGKKSSTSPVLTVDLTNNDDVKLMLYHWSIAVDSMGQTARVILKSLEQLYCAHVWE